jgi:hypothetical protein
MDTPSDLLYVITGGSSGGNGGDRIWRYDLVASTLDLILAAPSGNWGLQSRPGYCFVAEDGT